MRVRCLRVSVPGTGVVTDIHPALRVGGEYVVIEVTARPEGSPRLRLFTGANDDPAVWEALDFEVVDGTVPPNWSARIREGGYLSLAPAPWLADGFWEHYFGSKGSSPEDRRAARIAYARELELILTADRGA